MNTSQVLPSLLSIGRCCQLTQSTPNELRTVAAALAIRPAVTIDGVEHFIERDVRTLQQHIGRQTHER